MAHDSDRWSPSDELLDRFLAEHIPPDERAAIEGWLARAPAAEQTVQALRQLRFDTPMGPADHDALWQRIEQRIDGTVTRPVLRVTRGFPVGECLHAWSPRHIISGVALSLVLLVAGWWIGDHGALRQTRQSPLVYSTGKAERANVTLPDGSTVVLNVASRLEVPIDYGTHNRTVRLTTGEAQFHTIHNSGTPFTVIEGTTISRVLGTTFLMRHYPSDQQTTVAVQDGKVAVGATILTAGRMIAVSDRGTWRTGIADPSQFSFVRGVLTLPEMSLTQAIPELNRWYDADIQIGDPAFATRHIVGEFRAGSVADLRAILAMTFDIRVMREGRMLTLLPR